MLAFALLLFFSTMLWYLANGSLNDYLRSQVILQSHYYSDQQTELLSADFSSNNGITIFQQLSLNNIDGLTQPKVLTIDRISAQLAKNHTRQLDSPSIQKKTTTLVHIQELRLSNLNAWSEVTQTGSTNLEVLFNTTKTKLATDYPALYPKISAENYAKKYPERNEVLALAALDTNPVVKMVETNQAIIASKEAKQKKRLLGKAQTRIKITAVIIENLSLTIMKNNIKTTKEFKNISLGSFGNKNGLESNQLGGELLKQVLYQLIHIEKAKVALPPDLLITYRDKPF